MQKSGHEIETYHWDDQYNRSEFESITNFQFEQKIFTSKSALVALQSENGYRLETEFRGQPFDSNKFKIVEKRWDHEHCRICNFKIKEDYSYWENAANTILCDVCHQHIQDVVRPQRELQNKKSAG